MESHRLVICRVELWTFFEVFYIWLVVNTILESWCDLTFDTLLEIRGVKSSNLKPERKNRGFPLMLHSVSLSCDIVSLTYAQYSLNRTAAISRSLIPCFRISSSAFITNGAASRLWSCGILKYLSRPSIAESLES